MKNNRSFCYEMRRENRGLSLLVGYEERKLMKKKSTSARLLSAIALRLLLGLVFTFALAACAAVPDGVVDHAFGFDMRYDNQDAEVLDYRYGKSNLPVYAPEDALKAGKIFGWDSVQGPMLRGDFLFVKWRNKASGQVYEDNVDLRTRLPSNIIDKKVYFMVRGAQLFVYLISLNEEQPSSVPFEGPRMYRSFKTIRIYPD